MITQSWAGVTIDALQTLWGGFINFLPKIIGALIVILIGWAIAVGLGKLVAKIIRALRVDSLLEKMGAGKALEQAGLKLDIAGWLGVLVKWFLIIVFLMAATDILGLKNVTAFLTSVIRYLPNLIVAAIIVVVGVWAANILQKLVKAGVSATRIKAANLSAALVKWAVIIFTILAALMQLGVVESLIRTIVTGFIAMLAIAAGLAFGLGGRELASKALEKVKKEFSD